MIFLGNSQAKIIALVSLAGFFISFVGYSWVKSEPFSDLPGTKDSELWSEIATVSQQAGSSIGDSLEIGQLHWQDMQDGLVQQVKQSALVETAKDYLNNTSTPTTTEDNLQ